METHTVYVLLSRTHTGIGRLIRLFMRGRYNHVALSLDETLLELYSFARLHIDAPLAGGFLRETPAHYLYGGTDAEIKLFAVEMTEARYGAFRLELARFLNDPRHMIYNLLDALFLPFGKRKRISDAHTCVSFAAHMLDMEGVNAVIDMERALRGKEIYCGSLLRYLGGTYGEEDLRRDEYFVRRGFWGAARDTASQMKRLYYRMKGR
ncbi:MAG: hypothetical protein LLF87_05410 [Eubacteriales bacterium]|nr:hypothetical protein [Eubacteriales bacterium]